MCGRFALAQTREGWLALLTGEVGSDIPYDPGHENRRRGE